MLRLLLLLIASIGPGLLWLWYFYRQDRYEPEPVKMIFKVFVAGLVLVIPAGLLEQLWRNQILSAVHAGNWPSFLVTAFFVIALIEESLKTGFLWWLVGNNKELDEPVDGIIYGITLGLGFASLENLLWASAFGFGVAALRAVITTLAHASFTGWMGYFISKYKFFSPVFTVIMSGFLLAWFSHGLYDFLLFLRNPVASLISFIIIAGLLLRLYQIIQKQVAHSPFKK
ncbi:MAG TPA: PrsW family intramembrane metalloprotease [Firmicutes bacterium]|jgi:protease PrsW|nr:PrsW family intramembrane metalloprotease [Bacillota bacterium]